jgi:hypothetical protein
MVSVYQLCSQDLWNPKVQIRLDQHTFNWLSKLFISISASAQNHPVLHNVPLSGKFAGDVSYWCGDCVDSSLLYIDEPPWEMLCPAERICLNPIQQYWQACKMTTTSNTTKTAPALKHPILYPFTNLWPSYSNSSLSLWIRFASSPATNSRACSCIDLSRLGCCDHSLCDHSSFILYWFK